jgi:hypothetical protein
MSSKSSWQEDVGKNQDKGIATAANASLAELERKHKAQISDLINRHKEDTKKIYAKKSLSV